MILNVNPAVIPLRPGSASVKGIKYVVRNATVKTCSKFFNTLPFRSKDMTTVAAEVVTAGLSAEAKPGQPGC
jgi:uncharacterized membrane protein YjjB (DUF3815 family)